MACWVETRLSEEEFNAALHDEANWDGGMAEALQDGRDFLKLVSAKQGRPTVILLQEGYHKLQPAALDRQLPAELRASDAFGSKGLKPAAPLFWRPSPNLLHPAQLLARELTGRPAARGPRQPPLKCPVGQLEPVPFAVAEHCRLLEVQYILKELHEQQQAQLPRAQQAQQRTPPAHQQVWGESADEDSEEGMSAQEQQQEPLCRRLSVRVVLQRLPAVPPPDQQPDDQQESRCDSSWQQRGLQGCGQMQQLAYTCVLEYPAFTLRSSDYIVPSSLFFKGLSSWQALHKGEAFTMPWDGTPWRGFVLGYRQRRPGDPFWGSPWLSIAVEWEGHSTDRKKDPDDWLFGNPWEMTREGSAGPPKLPDLETALATASKAGRPVLAAPWSAVGQAVAEQAALRAAAKRKRQGQHQYADDFIYDENLDEDAAAVQDADVWDPADFYYDDDPEDFDLEADQHMQPRRKGTRRQYSSSARHRTSSGKRGGADSACCSGRAAKAAPASGENVLTHNYGRELLAQTDACVVCGSAEGSLVTGHTGRGGNCTRLYHTGCLLLLNAAGIRSVVLGKAAQPPRKRAQASSSSNSRAAGPSPAAAAAQADALCDGLLGLLWQQSQQPGHQQSPAVLAAVAAARETAGRVVVGELAVNCPSHTCHGCRLNGKLEFMTWCCGCWVRVYHHRQCVPYGAEHVQLNGRDFILCPHCRVAGVAVPGSAAAAAEPAAVSNVAAAGAAAVNADPSAAQQSEQGASGDAAAVQQHQSLTRAGAADTMQTDQQQGPGRPQTELKQQQQQRRQESPHSADTLQMSESESAGVSAAAPAAVGAVEVVGLLDSSEAGDREFEGVLEVSSRVSSDDAEQQRFQEQQPALPQPGSSGPAQAAAAAGAATAAAAGTEAGGAVVSSDDELDIMLDAVADLDAQLEALRQQQQLIKQAALPPLPPTQQQQQVRAQTPAGAPAAGGVAAAVAPGVAGASVAAAVAAVHASGFDTQQPPRMPAWLQLSLEDHERLSPSYRLVPCAAADGASGSSSDALESAAVLAAAAAAARTLPPAPGELNSAAADGLPLAGPYSHVLIGCVSKAEALYRPANLWGCAMIAVSQCPDETVYGLGLVVDYVPALQQQQQQAGLQGPPHSRAAAEGSSGALAVRARPAVYLRCSKAVAQSGALQPSMHARGEGDKRAGNEWQVLVNGEPYPSRQGKKGVLLCEGDVITVQGLHFQLQLCE